jgi:hypothetical protein
VFFLTGARCRNFSDILSGQMVNAFYCPYLGGAVQLSQECEAHIAERRPDLLP